MQGRGEKILMLFQLVIEAKVQMCNKIPSFRETQLHLSGKVLHIRGDIGGRKVGERVERRERCRKNKGVRQDD